MQNKKLKYGFNSFIATWSYAPELLTAVPKIRQSFPKTSLQTFPKISLKTFPRISLKKLPDLNLSLEMVG